MCPSRRRFALLVAGGASALTGCTEPVVPPSRRALSFDATVVDQSSASSPAALRLSVRNTSERPVELFPDGGSPPLEYLGPFRATDDPGEIVAFPPGRGYYVRASGELATSRIDGCWRFVTPSGEDLDLVVVSSAIPVTLDPGAELAVTHRLYYRGPEDRCPARGTYTTTEGFAWQGDVGPPAFEATYELAIDGAGTVTVENLAITEPSR